MEYWHLVTNVSVAILPVIIYIVVVYTIDRFELISLRRLMLLVLCGVLAAVVCFGIFQLWSADSQLSTFNFQLSTLNLPLVQFAVVFGTMGGLLVWICQYDTNMIHRWIDRGLDKQLKLILAIRDGHLDQTPTGQFLMTVKDAFPPEVFFDLICYVQLHIELSIVAKSRFMTRGTGMEYLLDEERRSTLLSQHEEYRLLERSLGPTARMSIAPLLKINPADRKALDDLIKECKTQML